MAIVAGSLIFRPNRRVSIGSSCGRTLPLGDSSRLLARLLLLHPRTCGLPAEPQEERVLGFEESAFAPSFFALIDRAAQKSMPPIPPMPPPGPPGIAGLCLRGSSATIASVVISRPAMEAA